MMGSMEAIQTFKTNIGYKKEGILKNLYVTANVNGKTVYADYAGCAFSYQAGYFQYSISIDWKISNDVMRDIGLHGSYNTNFQTMKLVGDLLYIEGDNFTIVLSKSKM